MADLHAEYPIDLMTPSGERFSDSCLNVAIAVALEFGNFDADQAVSDTSENQYMMRSASGPRLTYFGDGSG